MNMIRSFADEVPVCGAGEEEGSPPSPSLPAFLLSMRWQAGLWWVKAAAAAVSAGVAAGG